MRGIREEVFNLFQQPLPAGTQAPDFECLDEQGHTVSLHALRGRPVLLVFYPGDDTPGCRKQLCEVRDSWQQLKERGVAVFGVNPQGAESHRRFSQKYGFPFPILVDTRRRIAEKYHAGGLLVKRTVVLIGSDGIIRFSERGMPSPETVLRALPNVGDTSAGNTGAGITGAP